MAASSTSSIQEIEEILTCCICFEIFTSPKSLPCTHTYCQKCLTRKVQITQKDGEDGILCPMCRQFSRQGEFVQTYMLNEFLEFYWRLKKKTETKLCELCEGNPVKWNCIQCKTNMCGGCQNIHKKTPNCKSHNYKICDEDIGSKLDKNCYCADHPDHVEDLYCLDCQRCICLKCKVTVHDGHTSETVEAGIERLVPLMKLKLGSVVNDVQSSTYEGVCLTSQVPFVNKEFKTVQMKYKKDKDQIISNIEKEYVGIVESLELHRKDNIAKIEEACERNKVKTNVKQNIVNICKTTLHTAEGCSLLKGLTEGLMGKLGEEELKGVEKNPLQLKMPQFVKKRSLQGASSLLQPCYDENVVSFISPPWEVRSIGVKFQDIMAQVQTVEMTVDCPGSSSRLALVDNAVWIPQMSDKGKYWVFETHSNTLTQVSNSSLGPVISFCQTSNKNVIAACSDGLYSLDTQGEVEYKISGGSFTDVSNAGNEIYCLESKRNQLQVFKLTNSMWFKRTEFALKENATEMRTLHVIKNAVFVSQPHSNVIHMYSTEGKYVKEYGDTRGNRLGQFSVPIVSGSDSADSLVVCDNGNSRIQVSRPQGRWQQYKIEGIKNPSDVLVLRDRLFVLFGYPKGQKLSVFKLKTRMTASRQRTNSPMPTRK